MSTALIGLSIIQFVWIKWSIDLSERNFNDKVLIAISRTKDKIQADVKDPSIITYANRSKEKFISEEQLNLRSKKNIAGLAIGNVKVLTSLWVVNTVLWEILRPWIR